MEPGRPLGRRSIRARPPERVFGYFLHGQKVPRRRPGRALLDRKGLGPCQHPPPALRATSPIKGEAGRQALSKEMGAGKTFFQDAVLGWKRARSSPPFLPGSTLIKTKDNIWR